jgi:hypothetical protein
LLPVTDSVSLLPEKPKIELSAMTLKLVLPKVR